MKKRLKAAREHAGLSRKQFGQSFKVPLSYETIRTWETGLIAPVAQRYKEIADITGTRFQWIAAGAGPMTENADITEPVLTPSQIRAQVEKMSRDERMLWLQAIAEAEAR